MGTEDPNRPDPGKQAKDAMGDMRVLAKVWDLLFLLVGCIVVGGGLGYLLDQWFHTESTFTLIVGILGFGFGITLVIRRLSQQEKREEKNRDGG